nr:hypothetical protein B0A51_13401 [Rachicladosporium sp. CCFEE 5018]
MEKELAQIVGDAAAYPSPTPTVKRKRTRDVDSIVTQQSRIRSRIGVKKCIVCTNETFKTRFPKLPHADADQHTSDVCFKCWEVHLNGQVATKGMTTSDARSARTRLMLRRFASWLRAAPS